MAPSAFAYRGVSLSVARNSFRGTQRDHGQGLHVTLPDHVIDTGTMLERTEDAVIELIGQLRAQSAARTGL